MPAPTGQALTPAIDMNVHLDSPSVPTKWFVNEHYDHWLFLGVHDTLVVAEVSETIVTLRVAREPEVVLPIPIEDFHSGYFVQE